LQDLRREGKAIFLNSHLLGELELVCDRVVILLNGRIVRQGVLADMLRDTLETRITVQGPVESLRQSLGRLEAQVEGATIVLAGQNPARVNELIDLLRARGVLIESVVPRRVNLEDVFVEAMGGAARVGAAPVARPAAAPMARPAEGGGRS
jgi:ABC-2 type transport system ATP-binding protein